MSPTVFTPAPMRLNSNEEMEIVVIISGQKKNFEDNLIIFPCCNDETLIPTVLESFLKVTQPHIALSLIHI